MNRFFLRTCAIALVIGAVLVFSSPPSATAFSMTEIYPADLIPMPMFPPYKWVPMVPPPPPDPPEDYVPTPTATFYMSNIGGYMIPKEPNPDDLMTKTQWGAGTLEEPGRVVIHTFGSDFDTVLAAYRGSSLALLDLLAVNDNYFVPGISSKQSLVQFDVEPGEPHRVQIGGRKGAEGDIYATVSVLPPGGGLSVFLAKYGGISWQGRNYVCELGFSNGSSCQTATFVVHNSANQTLSVKPSASLDGAFDLPAAFTLAPGQAKTATFTYNTAFDTATLRTVAGYFTFTGRAGSTLVSRAYSLGLISVKSQTGFGPDVLSASVTRQVGTTLINNGVSLDVKLTNTGNETATGCHARSEVFSRLKTSWQELRPPATTGEPNVPVAIPAGDSKWLRVRVTSQAPRDADPPSLGEIIVDCANTAELEFDLSNRFDLTALSSFRLRNVDVAAVSPAVGRLDVPSAGLAKFRTSVTNKGAAANMRVNGFYLGPYDDPLGSQFTVTGVCEADAAGKCIGPTLGLLFYEAPKNFTKYFNVFVKAPVVDPGYDPGKRRVFLNVKQETPDSVSTNYVLVGTRSVAVRKK